MALLLLFLLLSLAGVLFAVRMPDYTDLILLAGPTAAASLILILWHLWRKTRTSEPDANHVILDGSNIMYWRDQSPELAPLRDVLANLKARGMTAGIVFDANAGHLLFGCYQHDDGLGRRLGLPQNRVMVVAKGTPADPAILQAAQDMNARVVTNDRFRDWVGAFPEVRTPGFLIRGGYHDGRLWLDLDLETAPIPSAPKARGDPHCETT